MQGRKQGKRHEPLQQLGNELQYKSPQGQKHIRFGIAHEGTPKAPISSQPSASGAQKKTGVNHDTTLGPVLRKSAKKLSLMTTATSSVDSSLANSCAMFDNLSDFSVDYPPRSLPATSLPSPPTPYPLARGELEEVMETQL